MTAPDMTPVEVTAEIVERDGAAVLLSAGGVDHWVGVTWGLRPADNALLHDAPLPSVVTLRLPRCACGEAWRGKALPFKPVEGQP